MGKPLTDKQFLDRLKALGGKKSALAKELGVGPSAISMRLKSIRQRGGIGGLTERQQKDAAKAAALVQKHISDRQVEELEASPFGEGIVATGRQIRVMEKLGGLFETLEPIVVRLSKQIDGGKNLKPFEVKMLSGLIRTANSILTDIHTVRKDVFNMQGTLAFMEAVVRILERQVPDVQQQLFLELSQLGFGEQIDGINPSKDSGL